MALTVLAVLAELLLADGRATDKLNTTPPFLELALTLLAALLVAWRPRLLAGPLQRAWRVAAASGRRRTVVASGVTALAASLLTMAWLGYPIPRVPDEFGYLLIGETLADGRLTNPVPRVPEAFEEIEVIVRPTYTAKYPAAPGALLALGERLGHPGIGICVGVGLLAGCCCWFLQGWLPPPWPAVGTALLLLRVGLASYWGQSYWGGGVAAVGGLLVYGVLPRLCRRAGHLDWLAFAVGLFLLANSRPVEGALAAVPALAVAGVAIVQSWRRHRTDALRLLAGLAVAAGLTTGYNAAVTGNPLRHPYQLHVATYAVDAMSPYAAPPAPVSYSSPILAANFTKEVPRPRSASAAVRQGGAAFARMAYFVCGLPLLAGMAATLVRLPRGGRRWRWKLFALLCCLLPAAFHSVTAWWFPHYSAAATGPLLLLGCLGMREAAAAAGRRRLAPWLAGGALLVQAALSLLQLSSPRHVTESVRLGQQLEHILTRRGERAVVVVDDRLRQTDAWLFNRADLAGAPILWIQDLGPEVTRRVAAAYAPRKVWRAEPADAYGSATLVPPPTE